VEIAASGRRVDVLVGPAGTGKTTTLQALRAVWEAQFGPGSVIGLAPSATAAAELSAALGTGCENTAKWIYESAGAGLDHRRAAYLSTQGPPRVGPNKYQAAQRARAAANGILQEQDEWTLQPGQLLIVDEASLAGTFTLDTLITQATEAQAKVVLVGDHYQLTAVEAGGAFGLLAGTPGVQELKSLWRFTNRWEANASRQLRKGNPKCLTAYEEHHRINAGASEVMIDAAYTAWRGSANAGTSTILVAADGRTVAALNTRAHDDRVAAGTVSPTGVKAADGITVGVGDTVVTRSNNRWLRLPDGHVRNGDLWTITATHGDGSITLSPAHHYRPPTDTRNPAAPPPTVHLPAAYAREHVELGYATTVHRAQGITVQDAHLVVTAGVTRQNLYVGMTRGRDSNHVYVPTDAIDPSCDGVPDPHSDPTGRDILEKILATDGADTSATQTMRDALDAAESLATLAPVRATMIADADRRRWEHLLPACGLTPDQTRQVLASPAAGPLLVALHRGEAEGHSMPRVLQHLITDRPLDNGGPPTTPSASANDVVQDLAAVLHGRVIRWHQHQNPRPRPRLTGRGDLASQVLDRLRITEGATESTDPVVSAVAEIDVLLRSRLARINVEAITTRPPWMQPLGELPTTSEPDELRWTQAVSTVAAYRDLFRSYGPTLPGGAPTTDRNDLHRQRTATAAARRAGQLGAPTTAPTPTPERGLTR
jgi:hypothetical protein